MNVVAVDDEQISLECLQVVLSSIPQISNVNIFSSAKLTLTYLNAHATDIAFLDIEMADMNGLELAAQIKSIQPNCKIIFVTSTPKYALNAFQVHANGYLVKPVTKEAILQELAALPPVVDEKSSSKLKIQTFGNFEVFSNGEPVKFLRSKSKELLAYLIDRKGASCSVGELCAVLWEDKNDDEALQGQLRKVISDLKKNSPFHWPRRHSYKIKGIFSRFT